jgi:Tol biopolymer transport system component
MGASTMTRSHRRDVKWAATIRRTAVIGAVAVAWLLSGIPPAGAAFPGTNGRIGFTANLSGKSWQLYTMNPDGTDVQRITRIPGSQQTNHMVQWAPNGRRLALMSEHSGEPELYLVRADGSHFHRVFDDPKHVDLFPTWSPDGSKLLFGRSSNRTGNLALFTIQPDGSDLTRITGARIDHAGGQYTPDSSAIIFDGSEGGVIAALYRVDADGSNLVQLTPTDLRAGIPDISPDGTHVVFYDGQNGPLPNSIWTMQIDGSELTRLTDAGCCFHDTSPEYSPDGTQIAFVTDRSYVRQCCVEIWVMDTDGSNVTQVTSSLGRCPVGSLGDCGDPDWGPAPV